MSTPPAVAGGRLRRIRPYELIMLFVLATLLALCIVVAQVVIQDARDGNENPPARSLGSAFGRAA